MVSAKMKRIVHLGAFVFACLVFKRVESQSVIKSILRLPDTGQNQSFTSTFGEDSDYSIHPQGFIDNGNGTLTDTVTGLHWQQSDGGEMTFAQAQQYADTLTLAGYTNWRLPTALESFSILNHQQANPALDAAAFPVSAAEYWWTSQTQVNNAQKVWATNAGGGIGNHPINETISAGGNKRFYARAVRDVVPPETLAVRFTNNNDGTISDVLTGLQWQSLAFSDSITWEEALTYAESLDLASYSDWRLPNIKELQSINDVGISSPSLNPNLFQIGGVQKIWSSTSLPNQPTKAWYLQSQFGITTYALKTARNKLLCVRGESAIVTAIDKVNSADHPYPNPFHNFIRVPDIKVGESIELYSSTGQRVARIKNATILETDNLPSGIYWLRRSEMPEQQFKLIKID
jgi:hypothetical protein